MKFSIFTPTHRPHNLVRCYDSIKNQKTQVPFEWVIVLNGGVSKNDIHPFIREDNRVILHSSDKKGIGALKNYAGHQCTGDVLIELDHDDILASDAFTELEKAHTAEPNGFYYSDFINLKDNGTCETYSTRFGWATYRCKVDGRAYTACRAFEPSARSMCQIFYAPNHIRAWSRSAYLLTGGHDSNMIVGDDHDLVCRTYIKCVPFVHIPKPLYIYSRHPGNSFLAMNAEIQTQQLANMHKYLHRLIQAECKVKNLLKLDVGRKENTAGGFKHHDIVGTYPNLLADYPNDSVGVIRAVDVLQRIPPDKIVNVINALYRVLSPGGWLVTSTPSIDDADGKQGRGAFQDPSNVSWWSENNFMYYTQKKFATLLPDYVGKFQQVRCWTDYPSEWHKKNHVPYVHADLCALKGQRQPGVCEI